MFWIFFFKYLWLRIFLSKELLLFKNAVYAAVYVYVVTRLENNMQSVVYGFKYVAL